MNIALLILSSSFIIATAILSRKTKADNSMEDFYNQHKINVLKKIKAK